MPKSGPAAAFGRHVLTFAKRDMWKLVFAYAVLLAVMAWLGRWTPDYLEGRDLWHFMFPRMLAAMIMLGVFASAVRLVPASLLLAVILLGIGTVSAIKREATGEPFQVSDLFLARQGGALFGYVGWSDWLIGALGVPAFIYALRNIRLRLWSPPLAALCIALLSTYRFEPVVQWIHDNSYWIGVENLTFSQAESERMNGLATHLYFSTAGLRLKNFTQAEVDWALAALDVDGVAPPRTEPKPDVFIILGEAWWRDPSDANSPLDRLVKAGFAEGTAISPVYGGTTPNAEFEVLTGVPVRSFQSGIIPYQHYLQYLSPQSRALPRLLSEVGYASRAYHNFEPRFWLRDQIYPLLGFASFDSQDSMKLTIQSNNWPQDDGLFARVAERLDEASPQFHFVVTVQTHGPYKEDKAADVIGGERHPGISDYRARLGGAVDDLVAFNARLAARGKPYVIFVFGDHLPGTRTHQWRMGWKDERDPRLHQVPFLTISNSEDAQALRDRMQMKPLTCVSPVMLDWLRLGITDRYMRHMAKACDSGSAGTATPSEAVIQNQLFTATPVTH